MKGKDKKLKKQKVEPCEVCRENYFDNQVFQKLQCHQCFRVVHKNCYFPDFKQRDKIKFKCDECKRYQNSREKSIKIKCIVCRKENGIMKQMGNQQFVHVLCALTTPKIRLNSYRSLSFTLDGYSPMHKVSSKTKCWNCHSDGSPGLQCSVVQCPKYSHLDCIVSYKYKQQDLQNGLQFDYYPSFTTIGLLDKHQNSLLVHLKNLKNSLKSLKLISIQKNEIRYLVCEQHNNSQYFVWCTCNKQILSEQCDEVQCEKCRRWFHKNCMKGQRGICIGCVKNDIYKKNAKFSELIQKAVQIEGNNKFDKTIIKFLDHFCLKLSQNILKIIEKNHFQIERYYLRKTLEQNAQFFINTDSSQPSKSKIKPLELLYYLCKKQLKDEKQIRIHQIQQILNQLKKDSSFQFNDKSEKIQKKYRAYVQAKRDNILKDDSHEVKYKLEQLTKKINTNHQFITYETAKQIHEIVKLLDKNQNWKQIYLKNHIITTDIHRNILECCYELKLSQDDIFQLLNIFKTISISNLSGVISESQYNKIIMHHFRSLADNKKKIYREIIQKLCKSIRIKREYEQKQRIINQIEQKLILSSQNTNFSAIREEIVKNNIMLSQKSNYFKVEANMFKMQVLKRQIANKSQQLKQSKLEQIISKTKKLLEVNKNLQYLTPQQIQSYEKSIFQYKFYLEIINFSNSYKLKSNPFAHHSKSNYQVMEEEDPEDYVYQIQNSKNHHNDQPIAEKIESVLKNWPFYDQKAVIYGLQQLFVLTNNKVQLSEDGEYVLVFMQSIIQFYNALFKQNKLLFSTVLIKKLTSLIIYSKTEQNYGHFVKSFDDFCKWKQHLQKSFFNIENILENPSQTQQLLTTIQFMLNNAYTLKVNVLSQCKKLQSIKMWALLSQKIFGHQKITITAAQQIKSIMDKIKYPKNSLRNTIQRLQAQAKTINKQISSFLQKNRQQQMQIFEQIAYMKGKMSISQGQILQSKLQSCPLDVEVQLQQLVEEIREFKSFAKDNTINRLESNESLEPLVSLRRKILENAFLYPNLEQYEKLLVKINQIKIRQFDGQSAINKKQYFKLLNHSGETRAQFYKNTQTLYKTYKDIEVAENQILNGKPKWELLLPGDCKKIRNQLKNDLIEKSKVQRWVSISQKLRQKYRILRSGKHEMTNYIQLQGQLLKIPINNKDIINDISILKRQQSQLNNKIKSFFEQINKNPETIQIQNHYNSQLIERYRKLSVKHFLIDKFQVLYFVNKEIMDLGRNINVDNYKKFTNLCMDVLELQKNNQIVKMRAFAFEKMKHIYLSSPQAFVQIGYNLLAQGGHLIGRQPLKTLQILQDIQQINQKFNAWTSNVAHRNDSSRKHIADHQDDDIDEDDIDIDIKQEDENENDSDEDEDDQDDDLQGLSSQLQDFEQDDENQNPNPRKRPYPGGDVVELDDD